MTGFWVWAASGIAGIALAAVGMLRDPFGQRSPETTAAGLFIFTLALVAIVFRWY